MASMNDETWLRHMIASAASIAGNDEPTDATNLGDALDGLGDLEWLLVVLSIETELKVDVPDTLASDRRLSVGAFVARVKALPRVDDPLWNLGRFGMLTTALLEHEEPAKRPRAKRAAKAKAPAKRPKTTAKPRPAAKSPPKAK